MNIESLVAYAVKMQGKAIAPYSHFHVGAAIQTDTGEIIGGHNIESASYGLTVCAERVALFSALSEGHRNFTHLVLVTSHGASPCGACRQLLIEFCPDMKIFIATPEKIVKATTSKELMPHYFSSDDLNVSKKDSTYEAPL